MNIIDEISGGVHEKHIYAGGMHIASNTTGTVEYYHVDHLGSTRLKTDADGDAIYESNYEPFGPSSGETGDEDYRYTGKQEDPSGLYYFGARYYDPDTGRFITRDTVFGDLTDPQSLNRYVYCQNNPHKYTDPDGKDPTLVAGLIIGTIAGAGIKTAGYALSCITTGTSPTREGVLVAAATGAVGGFFTVASSYSSATLGPGAGILVSGVGNTAEYWVETRITGDEFDTTEAGFEFGKGSASGVYGATDNMIGVTPDIYEAGEIVAENIFTTVVTDLGWSTFTDVYTDTDRQTRNRYLYRLKQEEYCKNYSDAWSNHEGNRY